MFQALFFAASTSFKRIIACGFKTKYFKTKSVQNSSVSEVFFMGTALAGDSCCLLNTEQAQWRE